MLPVGQSPSDFVSLQAPFAAVQYVIASRALTGCSLEVLQLMVSKPPAVRPRVGIISTWCRVLPDSIEVCSKGHWEYPSTGQNKLCEFSFCFTSRTQPLVPVASKEQRATGVLKAAQ